DRISEDERRLVVHRFDHEGRGFLFVYFEWFAATFPSAVVWRPSRREEAFWPEIFEIVSARRRGARPNDEERGQASVPMRTSLARSSSSVSLPLADSASL